jgi:mannose-6-phosphate isomerase
VILDAAPASRVYVGLKRAFDQRAVAREVARGTVELCLHQFTPRRGDCLFIPAGTVHALGAGLLVAEIQQASDTTFRLFDWNRTGPDGQPRALHVDQALSTIRYDLGPIEPQVPQPTIDPALCRLVDCEQFVLDRWQSSAPRVLADDKRFHLIAVIEGRVRVSGDRHDEPLGAAQTLLLPALRTATTLTPIGEATLLDIYLPARDQRCD